VVGGVESVMREHGRLMARAGHEVRIIAGRGAQADAEVEFTRLPLVDSMAPEVLALKPALDAGTVPPDFFALSKTIEAQLRDELAGTDWLIVHNLCSLNKNLAATSALRRIADAGVLRMALWHHDLAWTTARYRAQLHDRDPWDLLRTDWPGVVQVTVSEARRRELAKLLGVGVERIRVAPNGIDPYVFQGVDEKTALLVREFGLLQADPLLMLPARITPRKNIELALGILAHLKERFPGAMLLVTGPLGAHDPENQAYLESLNQLSRSLGVEQRAVFLSVRSGNSVPDDSMRQLYRLADALLLPSREEGFGIPILEAGLARLPVFCSDTPSLVELAGEDATYYSPDADPRAVAETIGAILSADRGRALRKRVTQEYSWDQIYKSHLAPILDERG
jgi:glycosyltransferase involved in cell wall biosynthesis